MAGRSSTGARGGSGEVDFDIKSNLRQVLADLKEFDPKLATEVRKRLRASGEVAIKAMGDILDESSGGTVTGKSYRLGTDRRGRVRRRVAGVKTKEANRARSTGARQEIKRGLKLKVTAGKSRTTVRLATTSGGLRKAMNTQSWRHPVFGDRDAAWVEQPGSQYFNRGAYGQAAAINAAMQDAIKVALDAIATRNITLE